MPSPKTTPEKVMTEGATDREWHARGSNVEVISPSPRLAEPEDSQQKTG